MVTKKKTEHGAVLTLLMLLGLTLGLAVSAVAQSPRRGGPPEGPGGAFGPGLPMGSLDLTEEQKTQVKALTDAARTESKPIQQQLEQAREQLRAAIESGGDLQVLATQQGELTGQLVLIQAKTQAQIYALLTPEQKDKLV